MTKKPIRLILRGAFVPGWTQCDQEEKDRVFQYWINVHKKWEQMGARLIATLDDEISMAGSPGQRMWNFYEIYEIPDLDIVKKMLDYFRIEDPEEIRLDKYFRVEAVTGYPIGSLERAMNMENKGHV